MESKWSMVKVGNLEVFYGGIQAIHNISLEIFQGEMVAIIEASGAGKSTLPKTLAGDKDYCSGTIAFQGQPLPFRSHQFTEKEISLIPEGRKIFVDLTVRDNLMVGAYVVRQRSAIPEHLEETHNLFLRLKERKEQMGETLSEGERQMLVTGWVMMTSPRLTILDEPSFGLTPITIGEMSEKFIQIDKKYGTTMIIAERNVQLTLKTVHRGHVLNVGKIRMEGEGQALPDDPRIQKARLGFK